MSETEKSNAIMTQVYHLYWATPETSGCEKIEADSQKHALIEGINRGINSMNWVSLYRLETDGWMLVDDFLAMHRA